MNARKAKADQTGKDRPVAPELIITADSAPLWRRLGPTAWMALQHLALSSFCTDHGWAAPVGVRNVAAGIGVTKDTAARAISTVTRAGLASRQTVTTPAGRRRSGYVLHLPETMRLIECTDGLNGTNAEHGHSPKGEYTRPTGEPVRRIPHPDARCSTHRPTARPGVDVKTPGEASEGHSWEQPVLFGATAAAAPAPSPAGTRP